MVTDPLVKYRASLCYEDGTNIVTVYEGTSGTSLTEAIRSILFLLEVNPDVKISIETL